MSGWDYLAQEPEFAEIFNHAMTSMSEFAIDPVTLNLDPQAAAAAITDRTTALLPVHIFGYPADVPALEAHGLPIVEDACEALGAVHGRPRRGRWSRPPGGGRLYAKKQLTIGEGGMLMIGSEGTRYDRLRAQPGPRARLAGSTTTGSASTTGSRTSRARSGSPSSSGSTRCSPTGRGWRAVPPRAGRPRGERGLELPCEDSGGDRRGWFVFVVQLPRGIDRDATILALRELGVQSKPYLPAIHLMSFYRELFGHRPGEFPVSEDVAERSVALPSSPSSQSPRSRGWPRRSSTFWPRRPRSPRRSRRRRPCPEAAAAWAGGCRAPATAAGCELRAIGEAPADLVVLRELGAMGRRLLVRERHDPRWCRAR